MPRREMITGMYAAFMHLTALPSWLTLARTERADVVESHVTPVLARYPGVAVRWFDVEAFAASSSDVLFAGFADPRDWNSLVEDLRDSPLFAVPYFRLDQLLLGLEDGFREHEAAGPH